jgi:hypothetical protein
MPSLTELIAADRDLVDAMQSLPDRLAAQQRIDRRDEARAVGERQGVLDPYADGGSKAEQAYRKIQALESRMLGEHIGRIQALGAGAQQIGSGIGGAAGFAGKGLGNALGGAAGGAAMGTAGAVYLATTEALGKTAQAMNIFANGAMSDAQKRDAFASEFLPGADKLIAFRDALNGVTEALRKTELRFQLRGLEQQQQFRERQTTAQGAAEVALHATRATAFGAIVTPPTPLGDRTTWQGDLAHQEALRRMERQDEIARARAGVTGAGAALEESQKRLEGLEGYRHRIGVTLGLRERQLRKQQWIERDTPEKRRMVERKLVEGGSNPFLARTAVAALGAGVSNKAGVIAAGREVQLAATDAANNEKLIQGEINRQKELGVQLAEKESALRKANIGAARTELEITRARIQLGVNQSVRAGGMQPWERQQSLMAARFIKQHGLAATPAFMQQQAGAMFPEYVQKEREKFGRTTEEYKAGVKEGFAKDIDIVAERAKEAKISTEVRVAVNLDEAALGKRIAEAISDNFRELLKSIKAEFDAQRKHLEAGNIIRNRSG